MRDNIYTYKYMRSKGVHNDRTHMTIYIPVKEYDGNEAVFVIYIYEKGESRRHMNVRLMRGRGKG